ncbi:hypothetical protein EVA_14647 [gut metagenome]|uniref:Uncharacterized protein n=1 Tax=gut metagenome TaxID=749906 RepID=J9CBE0_9ZZZZ
MLWRSRRRCSQSAIGLAPKEVFTKERTTLDQRIGRFAEKLHITGIIIIVPKMSSQPRCSHRIVIPRHIATFERSSEAKNIGRNTCSPTSCAPISLCCTFTWLFQQLNKSR